jgi:hypothetical protein
LRERRRISRLKTPGTWFLKTTTEMFRAAVNKVIIARMNANIRKEWALEEEDQVL